MKKTIFPSLFIALMLMTNMIFGQSNTTETRKVNDFTKVSFGVPGTLIIKFGPEYNLVIEGPRKVLDETLTEVSGDKLVIRRDSWRMSFNDEKVTINLTMPEIEGLGVSGSGRAEIADPVKNADELYLSVSGSGKILASGLEADRLKCSISGSGDIKLASEGQVDSGDISISGSGTFTGEAVEIDHLEVSVSGSGDCYCKAGDSLEARVSGSGNIVYSGNPKIDARVSGSGKVRSR